MTDTDIMRLKSIYPLLGPQIDVYWDNIWEGFCSVPGFAQFYTPEYTYSQLKRGEYQVWALSDGQIKGIVLTQMFALPRSNVLEILCIFGVDMMDYFEEIKSVFLRFAAQNKCDTLMARVRPGLARKLKRFHPKEEYVVLSYPIPQLKDQ